MTVVRGISNPQFHLSQHLVKICIMPQIAGVTVSSCFKPLELRPADAFHCGAVEPMTCQWHGRCCVGIEHSWVKNRLCFRVLLKPLSLFGTSKPDKKSDLNLFFFRRQAILCNQYVYIYIYLVYTSACLSLCLDHSTPAPSPQF